MNKIIRNRKDKLIVIFSTMTIFILAIGAGIINDMLQPAPEPIKWTINGVIGLGFIMICASTLIHGFHPILLFKH